MQKVDYNYIDGWIFIVTDASLDASDATSHDIFFLIESRW